MGDDDGGISRRRFVKASAALAAAPLFAGGLPAALATQDREVEPQGERAQEPRPEPIRIGLIGCGGRGTGAALNALSADKGVTLTALADVFADRLESCLANLKEEGDEEQIQVGESHRFLGFDAYRKLLESGVDGVLLATPPAFRPEHLRAAVAAGKHVFCEKPMAVDAPGVRSVLESAARAREKGISLVSGFCWRYSAAERATIKKLHDGALGAIRAVYTTYNTGPLGTHPRKPEWSDMEWQLRNWQHFAWLSGDHIVEQACHSIDKMAWAMRGELPERATAVGGRQARSGPESGHIYDHFGVTYEFPSGARGFHMCRQIDNCAHDNSDYIMGEKGICDINGWAPRHRITGESPWLYEDEGEENDMYQQEHDELFASIRSGEPINVGEWMAHSTLMAIMGRMAAYTGQTITWEQALASEESLAPATLEWGDLPVPAIAIPGKTKLL
ncbi:MAG: Gfo/Idh/MocA family protein [Planctomycetota bacterium]